MQILTVENQGIAINSLQEEIDDDMRFSVLDNSDVTNPDFYFVPLVFLESFSSLEYFSSKVLIIPITS